MILPARRVRSARSLSARDLAVPTTLRDAYRECRRLTPSTWDHLLLGDAKVLPRRRPHVQALYGGFCRHADEIVDAQDGDPLTGDEPGSTTCRPRCRPLSPQGSSGPEANPAVA